MMRPVSEMPLSAARNMVRALRQGGFLPAAPPVSPLRGVLTLVLLGLVFGAVVYLLAVFAVPHLPDLVRLVQKDPPPTQFVRPA